MIKNFYRSACLYGVLLLLPGISTALNLSVENALVSKNNESYLLSAQIAYWLSPKALDALQNGVPLFWDIHIKILQQRDYLWDKTLMTTGIRYRIQYHALLNRYRVKNESNGDKVDFSTLSSALDSMSTISNFRLVNLAFCSQGESCLVGIKVTLDRDALPLPLRPTAYTNPQWYLSSDWTLWPLKK